MNLESYIIKTFSKQNDFIGDDCAYIKETKQLISTDNLIENTHFDLKSFTAYQIAHRLFLSNYSDIQSSGGMPKYALFNISFPKNKSKIALSISRNLKKISKINNVEIIGGDTTSSKYIFLSLTIISKKIDKAKVLFRSKARINDDIYTFKNIGFSKLGFLNLYQKFKLPIHIKKLSIKQFLNPKLYKYFDLFEKLPVNSSMDISDGLYTTLEEMALQSKKKFIINNIADINPFLRAFINNEKKYLNLIFSSGEEYIPVFTASKNIIDSKIISLFKKRNIEIIKIGSVSRGKGVKIKNFNLTELNFFNHFNKNYLKL